MHAGLIVAVIVVILLMADMSPMALMNLQCSIYCTYQLLLVTRRVSAVSCSYCGPKRRGPSGPVRTHPGDVVVLDFLFALRRRHLVIVDAAVVCTVYPLSQ